MRCTLRQAQRLNSAVRSLFNRLYNKTRALRHTSLESETRTRIDDRRNHCIEQKTQRGVTM